MGRCGLTLLCRSLAKRGRLGLMFLKRLVVRSQNQPQVKGRCRVQDHVDVDVNIFCDWLTSDYHPALQWLIARTRSANINLPQKLKNDGQFSKGL